MAQIEPSAGQKGRVEAVQGLGRVHKSRDEVHERGGEQSGHDGACAQLAAQEPHRKDEQGDVEHVAERTHLDGREKVVEHDAEPIHAARHDVVGIDEDHKTHSQNGASGNDACPRGPPLTLGEVVAGLL